MRMLAVIGLVTGLAAALSTVPAAAATTPTLRVGSTSTLSVVGAGFRPRVLVTLRVVAPGLERRVSVRTGARGGFTLRFPALDRCAPNLLVAHAANGTGARVSPVWFVRECPPPPPLAPGVAGA